MTMERNKSEHIELKEDKMTIRNIHVDMHGVDRTNRMYIKQFEQGAFVAINNGKTTAGEDRNCYIFLSNEQIAELKEFLK